MKVLLVTMLGALALAGAATAGGNSNQSLCAKFWPQVQSSSGGSFSSLKECAKSHDVYAPTASITPTHVAAGETFYLSVTGFHPNAHSVVYFAITGQASYGSYTPYYPTAADGSFSIPFSFQACGNSPDDLTLTFVDSYGVHASARMTLC